MYSSERISMVLKTIILRFGVCIALGISCACALFGAEPAPAPQPIDPMLWSPPAKKPDFAEVVTGDDYMKRFAAALAKIDKAALLESKVPPRGLEIESTVPGSQAEAANIHRGDFMIEIGGQPIKNFHEFEHFRSATEDQTITLVAADGKRRTVPVKPGKIGLNFHAYENFGLLYLQAGPRDAKWDDQILVAAAIWESDPKVAETALFHAVRAGFPGSQITDQLAAEIFLREFNYEKAIDLAWSIRQTQPENERLASIMYFAAISSYKLELALELSRKYPLLFPGKESALERLVGEHKALPAEQRARLTPTQISEDKQYDSIVLRSNLFAIDPKNADWEEKHANDVLANGADRLKVPTAHYRIFAFGPGAADLELDCSFKVKRTDKENSQFAKTLQIGMFEWTPGEKGPTGNVNDFMGVEVRDNQFHIHFFAHELDWWRNDEVDPNRTYTLKIVAIQGRCEIFLDKQRVLFAPLGDKVKLLAPTFKSVGMDANLFGLSVYELVDKKQKSALVYTELNKQYRRGWTRLHLAARAWTLNDVNQLLDLGADPNIKDNAHETPLHVAVRTGRLDVAKVLKTRGAKLDAHSAAGVGDVEALTALLEKDPNYGLAKISWSPLHVAAGNGFTDAVKVLLAHKANIDAASTEYSSTTPLIWAVDNGRIETVKMLLDAGASVNLLDGNKHTALWYAQQKKNQEIIDILKAHKAELQPAIKPPAPPNPGEF